MIAPGVERVKDLLETLPRSERLIIAMGLRSFFGIIILAIARMFYGLLIADWNWVLEEWGREKWSLEGGILTDWRDR